MHNGTEASAPPLFLRQNPELIYVTVLSVEWALFAFMYIGLWLSSTPLPRVISGAPKAEKYYKYDIILGIAAGFSVFCLVATLIYFYGPFDQSEVAIYPKTALQFCLFFLSLVSGGFTEEVIFRGYFLEQFKRLLNADGISIFLQAVLFTVAHGFQETAQGLISKFLTGLLLGYIAHRTGRLLPTIVAHCGLNAVAAILSLLR